MADQKPYRRFHRKVYVIMLLCGAPLVAASVIELVGPTPLKGVNGWVWLLPLFVLPISVQLVGLVVLDAKLEDVRDLLASEHVNTDREGIIKVKRANALYHYAIFYLIAMAFGVFSYGICWMLYAIGKNSNHWENPGWDIQNGQIMTISGWWGILSYLALVAIVILLCLVIWLTRAIIAGGDDAKRKPECFDLNHLRSGAAQAPFLTLLFFLTIFLGVSFLFGFAFAFHDKSRPSNEPALYMRNLYKPSITPAPVPAASPASNSVPSLSPSPSPFTTFDFGTTHALWEGNRAHNDANLAGLVDRLKSEAKAHNQIRLLVVGHADSANVQGSAYKSNYELGEARALNIKSTVLRRLLQEDKESWRNIEWLCLSESNERPNSARVVEIYLETMAQDPIHSQVPRLEERLVPHLDAERPNPLNLMDYIYFSNYTITTTGYGDIVPNTVYAKLICSFANICEVFFLVVFFNTLLSLAGYQKLELMAEKVDDLHKKHGASRRPGQLP